MDAITALPHDGVDKVAIIPTDLPLLSHGDLELLDDAHQQGITLCPAEKDGGTNALVFTQPLTIPLLFGLDSCKKHQQAATDRGITVKIVQASGMQRDIDQPDDLLWLSKQSTGAEAWAYVKKALANSIEKA
jgi:2-phospho-L-lactate guanylyltransferase (CobY/MobA/RfbA family)